MEELAIVVLVTVLGGGVLLVGLIIAITTGSARSERIRRLAQDQEDMRLGLHQAYGRIAQLERALGEAMLRLATLRADQESLRALQAAPPPPAPEPVHEKAPEVAPPVEVAPPNQVGPTEVAPAAEVAPPNQVAPPTDVAAHNEVGPTDVAAHNEPGPTEAPNQVEPAPVPNQVAPAEQPVPVAAPAVPVWSAPPAPEAAPPMADAAREAEQASPLMAAAFPPLQPPAPPPPPPPAPPPAPQARFDWERWVGVRGAAALGACVLVIAGLYFFKYSIEQGLISPALRVVLGTLVGLGGIVGSELMLRRRYTVLANWLAGAGVAILYIDFWAAHGLYQLIDSPLAFGLMILVTAVCGMLSMRHDTLVIALLGLAGGFATPVALSTGGDHPIGLFGYLLILDAALLYLAHRRRWPVLGALSLAGTVLYQIAWIGWQMDPDRLALGMGIVVIFSGVYGYAVPRAGEDQRGGLWSVTRVATVLLPFAFGLYFGLRSDLGARFYPLGLMVVVLTGGAAWLGRARAAGWISLGATIAGTTVMGAWLAVHDRAAVAWEVVGLVALFAAVVHGFAELEEARPRDFDNRIWIQRASAVATLGALFLLVASGAAPSSRDPWPWIAGWLALAALAIRHSLFEGRGALRLVLGLLVIPGFALVHLIHTAGEDGEILVRAAPFPGDQVLMTGIVVVTALGLLSAALLRRRPADEAPASSARARPGAGGDDLAAILPFLYGLYVAARASTGPHLVPLAILITATSAGAAWAASGGRAGWIAPAAAVAGLLALGVWIGAHDPAAAPWEVAALACVFAAVFHAFLEIAERARAAESTRVLSGAAATASLGALLLLVLAAALPACHDPWPWLAAWLVLGGMTLRHAGFPDRAPLHVGAGAALGLAFPIVQAAHGDDAAFPRSAVWIAAALAVAIGVQALAFARPAPADDDQREAAQRWSSHGAALLALLAMHALLTGRHAPAPEALVFFALDAFAALALLSSARLGHGGWALAAAVAGAYTHLGWFAGASLSQEPPGRAAATTALAGGLAAVVMFAAWPIAFARRFGEDRWIYRAAAGAAPLFFVPLAFAWMAAFDKAALGALPLVLGVITFASAARARDVLPAGSGVRKTAMAWLLGVSLCAVSIAIPIQLKDEWVTVGWALEGLALMALWRRLDHAGLKYVSLVHLAVVSFRLGANPYLLEYHPRASLPVLNWLMYTYWVPVAALLGTWYLLRDVEVDRERSWEKGLYQKGTPIFAVMTAASAIVLFFLWINLTIFDAYGTGPDLRVDFERLPARDLTLSIAWALYALLLLAVGMARKSAALRWTSLALIIVTIGKVFLYDLSHLHDLYRVMSLVGLALSLILISLAYQRFVFGKREEDARPGEAAR
jgi:uncharacterized membrane protein